MWSAWFSNSQPQHPPKRSAAVVGLRAVVIHKDTAEPAIAKEATAEFSHFSRRLHPARRLRIELSEFLQFSIFVLRQNLDPHRRRHIHCIVLRLVFFPRIQSFAIVAHAS